MNELADLLGRALAYLFVGTIIGLPLKLITRSIYVALSSKTPRPKFWNWKHLFICIAIGAALMVLLMVLSEIAQDRVIEQMRNNGGF